MRSRLGGLTVFLLAVALLPASASASAKSLAVSVSPAKPLSSSARIVVSFKADRKLAKNARYSGTLNVNAAAPLRRCTTGPVFARSAKGLKKGATVKLSFKPSDFWKSGRWCAGALRLELQIVSVDSVGSETNKAVSTKLSAAVALAPGAPEPAIVYTPSTFTLLDGSAMTISAPGHADRTSILSGILTGHKPGKLDLNKDYAFTVTGGLINASQPVADPLCTPDPEAWPAAFAPTPETSTALVRVDESSEYVYDLPIDAGRLTGCKAKGAAATTKITLTGKLDSLKLSKLKLTGTISGITLADGTAATIAITVVVKVDILDELV